MKFATGMTLMLLGLIETAFVVSLSIAILPLLLFGAGSKETLVGSVVPLIVSLSTFWAGAFLARQGWRS